MSLAAIKTIHTGFRQMGITEEDDKRAFYMRIVGETSLKAMSEPQRQRVIEEQRRQGFKPALKDASKTSKKRLEGKYGPKIQALWIAGFNLGVVSNGSDEALEAFVKRETASDRNNPIDGLDSARWLHKHDDAERVIKALRGWLTRAGGVDWRKNPDMPKWANQPRGQIVLAQWKILFETGKRLPVDTTLAQAAWEICGYDGKPVLNDLKPKEWQKVMNELGDRIRKVAG